MTWDGASEECNGKHRLSCSVCWVPAGCAQPGRQAARKERWAVPGVPALCPPPPPSPRWVLCWFELCQLPSITSSRPLMSFSDPPAEVTCPQPPNIANGLHSGQSMDRFPQGTTVYYGCKDGFALVGNISINCSEAGQWSRPLPRCQGGSGHPRGAAGAAAGLTAPLGREGRGLSVQDGAQAPMYKGHIHVPAAIGCERPEVRNGKVHGYESTYEAGEILRFECDAGHATEGPQRAQCQPGGSWDPPVLAFRPCPMPPKIRNGQHDGHGKTFFTTGMSVMYSCDPGYYLVGNAQVVCKTLGNWSQPMPRCEGASICVQQPRSALLQVSPARPRPTFPMGSTRGGCWTNFTTARRSPTAASPATRCRESGADRPRCAEVRMGGRLGELGCKPLASLPRFWDDEGTSG
uniref:Sushi domain-containing protein n=1 Tax=Anas platyrhynchos platyrhynchos TaxID=8840 RepID=A0A493TQW7_ANAPP